MEITPDYGNWDRNCLNSFESGIFVCDISVISTSKEKMHEKQNDSNWLPVTIRWLLDLWVV